MLYRGRRQDGERRPHAARRCPILVGKVMFLLCIWHFIVQIRPCSVRLVYSSDWSVELAPCFIIGVVTVTGKTAASAAFAEPPHHPNPPFRITIWSSELCSSFIVAVYCYHAAQCSGLLTRRRSIISCKMMCHNILPGSIDSETPETDGCVDVRWASDCVSNPWWVFWFWILNLFIFTLSALFCLHPNAGIYTQG